MTRNNNIRLGAFISLVFVAVGLMSLIWTPQNVRLIDISARFAPASYSHWLGTDQLGRDVASLVMAGTGNALVVGLSSTLGALVIGTSLGLMAAALGGWVDAAIMRLSDIVFAFPALVLAILIGAVLGSGIMNAALAIALFNIPIFAKLSRAQALKIWPEPYILAARLAGKGKAQISFEHILPQMRGLLMAQALIQMSFSVAAESALSYVGLGAVPPNASWGRMIYDSQTLILEAPLLIVSPCVAIILLVFGLNRLAAGIQETEGASPEVTS